MRPLSVSLSPVLRGEGRGEGPVWRLPFRGVEPRIDVSFANSPDDSKHVGQSVLHLVIVVSIGSFSLLMPNRRPAPHPDPLPRVRRRGSHSFNISKIYRCKQPVEDL